MTICVWCSNNFTAFRLHDIEFKLFCAQTSQLLANALMIKIDQIPDIYISVLRQWRWSTSSIRSSPRWVFKYIPLLEIWFATFSAWFWQKKMKRSGWFKQCVLSTVLPRGSVRGERRAVGKMFLKRNRSFTRRRWRALSSLEIMRFYQSFVKRESWELRESPTWTTTACWMRQKVEAKVITWIFIRCTMQNIVGFILIGRYWRMNNG